MSKKERHAETKGRNTGLIRPRRYVWTAADSFEVAFEKRYHDARAWVEAFRYKPVSVWPDEAVLAIMWLLNQEDMIKLLRLGPIGDEQDRN